MKPQNYTFLLLYLLVLFTHQGKSQDFIEINSLEDKPIVRGEINGRKAYFLLDTGSDLTVLHERRAAYYKFKIKRMIYPYKVSGISGKLEKVHRAGNIYLILGDLPITSAYFTYDLSGIISSIYRKTSVKISGIIGSDLMLRYGFIIDYQQEKVFYNESFASAIEPISRQE